LAGGLVLWHILRLAGVDGIVSPWTLAVVVLGAMCADFLSGMVHWVADTWFHESMPVLGRRLLHPFRVYHVNPHDFLRRGFLTVNGDVAILSLPILLGVFALPLGEPWGRLSAASLVAMAIVGSV
jgi:plasmanylethanolamine desaturase